MWRNILIWWLIFACVVGIIANLINISKGVHGRMEYPFWNAIGVMENTLILVGIVVLLL